MEIIEIYKSHLYSVRFEGEEQNEFVRLFDEWMDIDFVYDFLLEHKSVFDCYLSKYYSVVLDAAEQVVDEASEMLSYFRELSENTRKGEQPDFDSYFKYLDGIYKCELNYLPVKGYGTKYRPTLIRFYAIKIQPNVYIIVAGGIKLGKKIQDSPGLKENVIRKIDKVREHLSSLGITEASDMY